MADKILELKNSLHREDPTPLYHQLERKMREMIEKGVLESGERLPNDMDLSRALDVNHLTLKKALSRLAGEGLIDRSPKAGTFVRERVLQTPTLGFFYFAEAQLGMSLAAEYMQRYLVSHGYDLKIVAFNEDFYDQTDLWDEVRKKQLSGAILVALGAENCLKQLGKLEKKGFPHVRLGNKYFIDELEAPSIRGNDAKRMTDALEYLWSLGHRRIGLTCMKEKWGEEGYREFYRDREFQERWLMVLGFWGPPEQYRTIPGVQLARGYLESNPDITAFLSDHALFCRDVMTQAEGMGRKIPEDLSVISINETLMVPENPRLSFMRLSLQAEAEKACEALLKVLKGEWKKGDKEVLVDYDFVERSSVAPVREPAGMGQ